MPQALLLLLLIPLACTAPGWLKEGSFAKYLYVATENAGLVARDVITIKVLRVFPNNTVEIEVSSNGTNVYNYTYRYDLCEGIKKGFNFYLRPDQLEEVKDRAKLVTENIGHGDVKYLKLKEGSSYHNVIMNVTKWIDPDSGLVVGEFFIYQKVSGNSVVTGTGRYLLMDTNIIKLKERITELPPLIPPKEEKNPLNDVLIAVLVIGGMVGLSVYLGYKQARKRRKG